MKKKIGMRKVGIRVVDKKKAKPPTNFDAVGSLDFIWDKLHSYRTVAHVGCGVQDEEWDDICTTMAWIEDECGLERIEGLLERKQPETKAIKLTGHFPDPDVDFYDPNDGALDNENPLPDGLQEYADGVARDILHRNYHKSTNGMWSSALVRHSSKVFPKLGKHSEFWRVQIDFGCQDDTRNEAYSEEWCFHKVDGGWACVENHKID